MELTTLFAAAVAVKVIDSLTGGNKKKKNKKNKKKRAKKAKKKDKIDELFPEGWDKKK